jgi:hypothetical protein
MHEVTDGKVTFPFMLLVTKHGAYLPYFWTRLFTPADVPGTMARNEGMFITFFTIFIIAIHALLVVTRPTQPSESIPRLITP